MIDLHAADQPVRLLEGLGILLSVGRASRREGGALAGTPDLVDPTAADVDVKDHLLRFEVVGQRRAVGGHEMCVWGAPAAGVGRAAGNVVGDLGA